MMLQEWSSRVGNQICGTAEMLKDSAPGAVDLEEAWTKTFPCEARTRLDCEVAIVDATRVPAASCQTCGKMSNLISRIADVVPGANFTGSSLEQVTKKAKHLNLKCACGGTFSTPILVIQEVACAFQGTLWGSLTTDERKDDPTLYKVAPSSSSIASKTSSDFGQMAINPFGGGETQPETSVETMTETAETPTPPALTLLCSTFRHKLTVACRTHGRSLTHTGTVYKSQLTGYTNRTPVELCTAWPACSDHMPDVQVSSFLGRLVYWTREAQYVGKKPVTFGRDVVRKGSPPEVDQLTRTFVEPGFLLGIIHDAFLFLGRVLAGVPLVLRECLESELCHARVGDVERLTMWRFETTVGKKVIPLLDITCRDQPVRVRGVPTLTPVVVVSCEVDTLVAM